MPTQTDTAPDFREVFPDEALIRFSKLVEKRVELKALMKQAEAEMKQLDEDITGIMADHNTAKVQYGDVPVALIQGSRSTISKERLVELGVPASTVQAATKTTTFSYVRVG